MCLFYVALPLLVFIPICRSNFSFCRSYFVLCVILMIPKFANSQFFGFCVVEQFQQKFPCFFLDYIYVLDPQTEIQLFIFVVFHVLLFPYQEKKEFAVEWLVDACDFILIVHCLVADFFVHLFFFHGCDFTFSS